VEPGRPAPDFHLEDLEGRRFYLSSCRGKAVVLNFWSVHCLPCKREMPELQKLWAADSARGLVVAGICSDTTEQRYVQGLVNGLGVEYPVLSDEQGRVAGLYGVRELPTTFFINRRGIIVRRVTGFEPAHAGRYREILLQLLSGQ
jgi:peroxiredoxin